jgi:phage FluMu protein Com
MFSATYHCPCGVSTPHTLPEAQQVTGEFPGFKTDNQMKTNYLFYGTCPSCKKVASFEIVNESVSQSRNSNVFILSGL